jgi:hypothetical protein
MDTISPDEGCTVQVGAERTSLGYSDKYAVRYICGGSHVSQ